MAGSVASGRAGNLPADVTSFVGRRRELADLRDLLQRARLITLTGVGGVGKTRLVLRAAAEVRRAFPDGVWLVELAGLREPGLVGQSVSAALGVQEHATGWSLAALSNMLAERRLLLVLDNCEHVVDACAILVDTLLKACPDLRILTTSRQPLHITGEYCLEVEPLATPAPDPAASLESVAHNDAVALFVERAAAVQPGFRLDEANAPAVASICRRLDGIALALELAAGRLRALSVEQLLSRLDSRYDVLIGGSRAALPRQQTMRALIDWSFALCTPAEQLIWARLSVFVDGFTLDAAEHVCADEHTPTAAVFENVEGLVDKSIISVDPARDQARYRMAETLREYGAHRLDELGETVATQRRARDWCAQLVERTAADWFSPRQADLLRALRFEHSNIQAALNFCLTEPAELTPGLAIAADLRHHWTASGRLSEGLHWLDRLVAKNPDPTPALLRALCMCAFLSIGPTGTVEAVDQMLDEADALARDLADPPGAAYVAQTRGMALMFRAEPQRSADLLKWVADEHRRMGEPGAVAYDLALLATAKSAAGHSDVSAVLRECLELCDAAGETWIRAFALWAIGVEQCKSGDLVNAARAQRESLELRIPLHLHYLMALNLDALAWVAVEGADYERAARLFGAAEAVMRDVGGLLVDRGPTAPMHEAYQLRALKTLGAKAFSVAHDAGLRMGFDHAVAYALGAPVVAVSASPTAPGGARDGSGLSVREFEVAQLVARGLTNKQIAAALVISQRTAEAHVEHVLAKLGFTSRALIAAWVTERNAGSGGLRT